MDNGIGATLREARSRRKVDLVDVEAAIKIRVRYLQAIENEEWDALPGGAYTRGFIRTYANYLGLDGERLADDFRRGGEPQGERVPKRVEPVPTGARRGGSRFSGRIAIAAVVVVLLGLLVAIGLAGGDGGDDDSSGGPATSQGAGEEASQRTRETNPAPKPGVALELTATAEVWVCLLDAAEEPLLEGQILVAGEEAGPFRSGGYELALGNGSVSLTIDGEPSEIEESSSPVGYEIGPEGDLTALEEGERPDCE